MTFYKLTQEKQYVDATPEPDPEEPATVPIRTALEAPPTPSSPSRAL